MRQRLARGRLQGLSLADSQAMRKLQHDCAMRHFARSPQGTQAGRAEMNSLLCAQQTLHGILQTIREQAGWPACDAGQACPACDDLAESACPSTARD